jgi:hypothetical protein
MKQALTTVVLGGAFTGEPRPGRGAHLRETQTAWR